MKIHVTYLAQLRRLTGTGREEVSLSAGSSLSDLLRALVQLHGERLAAVALGGAGEPHPSLLVFRGGDQVSGNVPLSEGDRVTLLTPMAGG